MLILKSVETNFPMVIYEIAQLRENKFALFGNRKLIAIRSNVQILEVMLSDYIK